MTESILMTKVIIAAALSAMGSLLIVYVLADHPRWATSSVFRVVVAAGMALSTGLVLRRFDFSPTVQLIGALAAAATVVGSSQPGGVRALDNWPRVYRWRERVDAAVTRKRD